RETMVWRSAAIARSVAGRSGDVPGGGDFQGAPARDPAGDNGLAERGDRPKRGGPKRRCARRRGFSRGGSPLDPRRDYFGAERSDRSCRRSAEGARVGVRPRQDVVEAGADDVVHLVAGPDVELLGSNAIEDRVGDLGGRLAVFYLAGQAPWTR